MPDLCRHDERACLNQYELIRKYRCHACDGVMMCACDREVGVRYLSHQLRCGRVLETQQEVPVTLGFQEGVCSECRGLPADPAPAASIHGRTTKISRYYWREIAFELLRRDALLGDTLTKEGKKQVEQEVMAQIKALHATAPKYAYGEISPDEVLRRTGTQILSATARHVPRPGQRVQIDDDGELVSPEEFATRRLTAQGYEVLWCESRPFHALFAIYLHLLIEDPADPMGQMSMFGSRSAFDAKTQASPIWISRPRDFGAPGYYPRRQVQIAEHFSLLEDSDWLFDYWVESSARLREYLWVHDPEIVPQARAVKSVIGWENLLKVLDYLLRDYWRHYLGWPDLLVHRPGEWFFVEVKSSKDRLSEDQKRWFLDNRAILGFEVKLFKISGPRR